MAGATLGASAVFATTAQAATTYTVTSAADDPPGNAANCQPPPSGSVPNNCTLRDAIAAVNGDGGGDTINFDSSLARATIFLTNPGDLLIFSPGNTIDGANAPGVAVAGTDGARVFTNDATSGTTTIENLTAEYGFGSDVGGAIASYDTGSSLVLSGDTIRDSVALQGAGVWSSGPLTISDSTITGNSGSVFGGGVSAGYGAHVSISNSTISDNKSRYGGGIEAGYGSMSVSGSQITGNTTGASGLTGEGGGIFAYHGSLSVSNTTISNNKSGTGGGIDDYSYSGATLSNLTVSGNTGNVRGGGIMLSGEDPPEAAGRQATIAKRFGITLPRHQAATAPTTYGPISLSDSTVSGNTAPKGAGMVVGYTSNVAQTVTVSASTISGNTASATSPASSFGGGLLVGDSNYGSIHSPFGLIDSTVSGNTADNGGGVSIGGDTGNPVLGTGGSVDFNNSTIASNTANASGGGIYLSDYATTSNPHNSATAGIFSTIVAGDAAAGSGNDLARNSSSTGGGFNASFSLIQAPGNAPLLSSQSVITGVDPQLGALGNNGGPTQTMLPAFTSPVIDQGKDSPGTGGSDQRGDPRTVSNGKPTPPGGDGTDIGSVELAKIPILAIIGPASGITGWASTLNGQIQTNGQAVTWHFQYGTTTDYGLVTPSARRPSGSIGANNGQVPVSFGVSGLHPHTRYHYRLVAVAANGFTSDSADATFTTLTPTINAQPHRVKSGKRTRLFGFAAGCPVRSRVTLFSRAFRGHRPVNTTVNSSGNYSVKTRIPKSGKGGLYRITASCADNSFEVTAHLRVVHPKAKVAKKPVRVIRFTG